MNDFENKVKEALEKEIAKYSPDDVDAVRQAVSEEKNINTKWNKIYVVAACLTFIVLVGSIAGILLKGNGNGSITENSTVSGAGHDDSQDVSQDESQDVSQDESEAEIITLAEKHPELAALPEGYMFSCYTSKELQMDYDIIQYNEKEMPELYFNYIDPVGAMYLGIGNTDCSGLVYVEVTLEKGEQSYIFKIYKNEYMCLTYNADIDGSVEMITEWYKHSPFIWEPTEELFSGKHPDMLGISFKSYDFCIFTDYKRNYKLEVLTEKQAGYIWNSVIDVENIRYIEEPDFDLYKIFLEMEPFYTFGCGNTSNSYNMCLYESGYISFNYIVTEEMGKITVTERYYKKGGFKTEDFISDITFVQKHGDITDNIESIIIDGAHACIDGKAYVMGYNAIVFFNTLTDNMKALYMDIPTENTIYLGNYIEIIITEKDKSTQTVHFYETGFFTLNYQDNNKNNTELYFSGVDINTLTNYLTTDINTFAEKHPDEMLEQTTNQDIPLIGIDDYSLGDREKQEYFYEPYPSNQFYYDVMHSGVRDAIFCSQSDFMREGYFVKFIAQDDNKYLEYVIYENGYIELMFTNDIRACIAGMVDMELEFYYNPVGFDLEDMFGKYIDFYY